MNVSVVVLSEQEAKMCKPHGMCDMTSTAGGHLYHNFSRFTFYLL